MSELDRWKDEERRLRRAAVTRHLQESPDEPVPPWFPEDDHVDEGGPEPAPRVAAGPDDEDEGDDRGQRFEQKALWVDTQIRGAMARGEFDNLPGAGKPLKGLERHDPDWWVRSLIERERISVLPPALALRQEDAALDARLDRETHVSEVRRLLEDFNRRVIEARRQLQGGPPVITPTRDVEAQVEAWRARRTARRAAARSATAARAAPPRRRRGPWWRRRHAG